MLDDPFLVRFMGVFQDLADTVHEQVNALPHAFDPTVAPEPMVRLMGSWMGLAIDSSLSTQLQRRLVLEYSQVLPWRGTCHGLERLLRAVTGTKKEETVTVEDSGRVYLRPAHDAPPAPPVAEPHVRVVVPTSGEFSDLDLARFVQAELPASMSFELVIGGRQVWPPLPEEEQDAPVLQETVDA